MTRIVTLGAGAVPVSLGNGQLFVFLQSEVPFRIGQVLMCAGVRHVEEVPGKFLVESLGGRVGELRVRLCP